MDNNMGNNKVMEGLREEIVKISDSLWRIR